jgi:hypothetical protein
MENTTRSGRPYWAIDVRSGSEEGTLCRHASSEEEAREKIEVSLGNYQQGTGPITAGLRHDWPPDTVEIVGVRLVSRTGSIHASDDNGSDLRD